MLQILESFWKLGQLGQFPSTSSPSCSSANKSATILGACELAIKRPASGLGSDLACELRACELVLGQAGKVTPKVTPDTLELALDPRLDHNRRQARSCRRSARKKKRKRAKQEGSREKKDRSTTSRSIKVSLL